ncbi:MAG: 30S ribosome-binding factor RbfA [Gemmatimonadota bacterium]|jgi:ribosome-binding factor A
MAREYARKQRVAKLLKEEISRLLQREVKDARIGMVTVTDVEVTADLKYATVYFQTSGDEGRKTEALEGLSSAAGFLRSRLGRELRLRRVPELRFAIDPTQEKAARIAELLAEVRASEQQGEGEDGH